MFVRIRIRRARGRLIPDHEAERPEHQLEGNLLTSGGRFELWPFMTTHGAPIAVLYDARVLSIRASELIIRGIEEAGCAAVLQEWECSLIPEVIGPDGLARWDIPELRGRDLGW